MSNIHHSFVFEIQKVYNNIFKTNIITQQHVARSEKAGASLEVYVMCTPYGMSLDFYNSEMLLFSRMVDHRRRAERRREYYEKTVSIATLIILHRDFKDFSCNYL